jgi:hypothetical protein
MQAIIENTFREAFIKEEDNSCYYARIIYPKHEVVFNTVWDEGECVHTISLISNGVTLPPRRYRKSNYRNVYSRYANKYLGSKK